MQLPDAEKAEIGSQEPPPVPGEGSARNTEGSEGQQMENTEGTEGQQMEKKVVSGRRPRRSPIVIQKAETTKLKVSQGECARKYGAAKERIANLEYDLEEGSRIYKETLAKRDQRIRVLEDELARTRELLEARTKELSGAQSFLSTTDRKSESEVLGFVRDLNESIFQAAANLTEEWEKRRSSRPDRIRIRKENAVSLSQSFGPALVRPALDQRPAAITFLVQSCLCSFVADVTSRWQHNKELGALKSVYQRLCVSEGQAISARWRSLAHIRLPEPPSHSDLIAGDIAKILWITGIFPSLEDSVEFVKTKAFTGIKRIEQLAIQLESVFMVDITSGDMCLRFEAPSVVFDEMRMTREYEGGKLSRIENKVAGTTEVGVEKSVHGRRGEGLRTQLLLKPKVVLERDLAGV